jgi:hypothetical protein
MRKKLRNLAAAVAAVFSIAASLLALPQIPLNRPDEVPNLYFTRLAYTQNPYGGRRGRGGGTMPIPPQFRCPEFGGGNFFPPQGWGWATDYPGGDCKLMGAINRLSGVKVHPDPHPMGPLDPQLFKFPFTYAVEVGQMYLSKEDAERLREFLLRGGFLYVDDFWGLAQLDNFREQIEKVFPEYKMERLPLTHQIFHTFFDIDEILQPPNRNNGCNGGRTWEQDDDTDPVVYGISDEKGRLMVVATYNADLGDAWEYMDLACYPAKFSGYAYRMGLNVMIYSMTH